MQSTPARQPACVAEQAMQHNSSRRGSRGLHAHLHRPAQHIPLRQQLLHAGHQVVVVPHCRLRPAVGVVDDQHLARGQLRHLLKDVCLGGWTGVEGWTGARVCTRASDTLCRAGCIASGVACTCCSHQPPLCLHTHTCATNKLRTTSRVTRPPAFLIISAHHTDTTTHSTVQRGQQSQAMPPAACASDLAPSLHHAHQCRQCPGPAWRQPSGASPCK